MDERVWLRQGEDSYFHCPAMAVDDWLEMGWQRTDPPREHNPVVAERVAAEAARAAEAKPTKTSRKGGTDITQQEG